MTRATALLLLPAALAGPAAAEEASLAARGSEVYAARCMACHGPDADRGEAGRLFGLPLGVLRDAMGGFEQMPAIPLEPAEFEALAAYLRARD